LVPHGIVPPSQLSVDFFDRGHNISSAEATDESGVGTDGGGGAVSVQDLYLYPEALSSYHVLQLANDPEVMNPLLIPILTFFALAFVPARHMTADKYCALARVLSSVCAATRVSTAAFAYR
jgi:hypothetical protein